jgi:hypothetical protein
MKPTPPSATFVYEDVGQDRRAIIPMWRFGAADANGTPDATGAAAQLLATTLRDGNFDYFTNTVKWDRPPQPIPDSLYLAAKPAFFGSCRWPWVDPVGATKTHVLPARTRFDGNPSACGPAAGLLNAPG